MFKKSIVWLFHKSSYFVICPYINNEAKYMAKGVKPFSALHDSEKFLKKYFLADFEPLIKKGIVNVEKNEYVHEISGKKVKMLQLFYYYPNEYWRVKHYKRITENFSQYSKSCGCREGILFGYPQKYLKRFLLSNKIYNFLHKHHFFS